MDDEDHIPFWVDCSPQKSAGVLSFGWGDYAFHFLVHPRFWVWGWRYTMEGAALQEWGLGPLFFGCRFDGKT